MGLREGLLRFLALALLCFCSVMVVPLYGAEDSFKSATGLDKLNVDDDVSKIVDDPIERDFLRQIWPHHEAPNYSVDAFLDDVCQDDSSLRQHVRQLLQGCDDEDGNA